LRDKRDTGHQAGKNGEHDRRDSKIDGPHP
jgi:hypothetical protein